jgi:hypothetical protein
MTEIGDGGARRVKTSPGKATPAPAGHNRGRSTTAWSASVTNDIAMMAPRTARSVERRIWAVIVAGERVISFTSVRKSGRNVPSRRHDSPLRRGKQ